MNIAYKNGYILLGTDMTAIGLMHKSMALDL